MKKARLVVRLGNWCRGNRRSTMLEHRLAADPEIKPFVRAKRNLNNMPDPWDTQFITIQKSWKWRCRKAKQWMTHKLCDSEIEQGVGRWYEVMFQGHIIRVQGHEKWLFSLEGEVYVSEYIPDYFRGLYRSKHFTYFCRKLNIKVEEDVCFPL